jgi:GNAT superfamily N-acetyltransferase
VFAGMSMPSRAARYLTPVVRLTPSMRRALSDVDGHDHVAWVAEVGGEPAALARYVRVGPCTVELALEVVDAQQGLGLGAAVLDAVTTVAVVRGFRRFQATLAADNHRSLRLLSELGLAPRASEGLLEGEAELRLLSRPRVDRASVARIALARPRGDRAPAALPCGRAAGD